MMINWNNLKLMELYVDKILSGLYYCHYRNSLQPLMYQSRHQTMEYISTLVNITVNLHSTPKLTGQRLRLMDKQHGIHSTPGYTMTPPRVLK